MYFRDKQALFWSLFFPMLIMLIFGLMNFDRFSPPEVGVVDAAQNQASQALVARLGGTGGQELLDIETGDRGAMLDKLKRGDVDAVLEIPAGFANPGTISTVNVAYDSRKPQERGIVSSVLESTMEDLFQEVAGVPPEFRLESRFAVTQTEVEGKGQGYKGFLVPGIAAMAIMQGGLFGVVFTIVAYKSRGILRRLKAAPINPSHVLAGQVATRLVVSLLQTYVLLLVGILVLRVTVGEDALSWVNLTVFAALGGALFIAMGLAISGWAKSEDTAAPVANVISLPMMFLSGVFFPTSAMPDWVRAVSQYLPLTYLADGLRAVALDGANLGALWPQLTGLAAWTAGVFLLATRVFKWE
jgi:ABC-2 type transport system permease protein